MIELQKIKQHIKNATTYALKLQHSDGYWVAPLDSNSTMEAEFLLLLYILGIKDKPLQSKVVHHILKHQHTDGSWSLYFEGPGDLSTTIECYFALLLTGISKSEPNMQQAKSFILSQGGLSRARVFTKIWLAMFGQWSWRCLPKLPPELIFLPSWFPINIYNFASWARATIVPLCIIMARGIRVSIPESCYLHDLINADTSSPKKMNRGWTRLFHLFDLLLKAYDRFPWKPGREYAIKKMLHWILKHQDKDGSWGGIQPPWVYSLIALKNEGYSLEHPVMKKSLQGFQSFMIETDTTIQIQACISPVWDTSLMVNALCESGLDKAHPALQKAGDWLITRQIKEDGDWRIKNPHLTPGGWGFEFENQHYPDLDDTAEVLMALTQIDLPASHTIKTGIQWMLGMQCREGGWAAFDKDNDKSFLAKIPFFDFGEALDPPSADVTAHVIEALGLMGYKHDHPVIQHALSYLYSKQEDDGSWFGRWGVNYIYGIGTVLPALRAVNENMQNEAVQKAVLWLLKHQNLDGGWGETCASYVDPNLRGQGKSTPTQTAWALLALLSTVKRDHSAIQRGMEYLCTTQNSEGSWDELYYTGCGFPGYGDGQQMNTPSPEAGFMIRYHLYRHCWPLLALGRYQKEIQ